MHEPVGRVHFVVFEKIYKGLFIPKKKSFLWLIFLDFVDSILLLAKYI